MKVRVNCQPCPGLLCRRCAGKGWYLEDRLQHHDTTAVDLRKHIVELDQMLAEEQARSARLQEEYNSMAKARDAALKLAIDTVEKMNAARTKDAVLKPTPP